MHPSPASPALAPQPSLEARPERIEILEAFADLPDVRKATGKRHHMTLCLALFTLAGDIVKSGVRQEIKRRPALCLSTGYPPRLVVHL